MTALLFNAYIVSHPDAILTLHEAL